MKIELSVAETNTILACLGRAPYEAVFALIESIRKQATDQSSQISPSELGSDK
jgi:hypothetical protein